MTINKSQKLKRCVPQHRHARGGVTGVTRTPYPQLSALTDTLRDKSRFSPILSKIGRTHLQDATPLTLGEEVSGIWVAMLEHNLQALSTVYRTCVAELALRFRNEGQGLIPIRAVCPAWPRELATITAAPFVPARINSKRWQRPVTRWYRRMAH